MVVEAEPAAIFQSKAATRHKCAHAYRHERATFASFRALACDGRMRPAIPGIGMKRRTILTLLSAAIAWPFAVGAQNPDKPFIGFLSARSAIDR